ncbi:hypothetical protein JRQ81_004451 [Phrynocephalus forsythii]|uniref:H15 domain-containing protein n=1 Tax=Phrynocephalus forsythii TaxID=171643 RepID=A0A9Q0XF81_9SAUR|nr:hypothetical protein JRQ81_004451 [Phrynocephalus forsythii]
MAEVAPPVASVAEPPASKAPVKKAAGGSSKPRAKPSGPSVTELLTQAVSASKERSGVSLAALKKSLAAAGYDVEKNNSRIKLGLKGLVSKGTLVQTKGTGASGSFKLNKKQQHQAAEGKEKAAAAKKKAAAAKAKKPVAKKPAGAAAKKAKKAASTAGAKKSVKAAKKPSGAAKKAASKSPQKSKVTKPKKTTKSPAKAVKPKVKAKPKISKTKVAPKKK